MAQRGLRGAERGGLILSGDERLLREWGMAGFWWRWYAKYTAKSCLALDQVHARRTIRASHAMGVAQGSLHLFKFALAIARGIEGLVGS